jgi:hypothetical protein
MNCCSCDITINYTVLGRTILLRSVSTITGDITVQQYVTNPKEVAQQQNGCYYTWIENFDQEIDYTIVLFWNELTARWEITYLDFPEFLIAYLDSSNICPFESGVEWVITDTDEVWSGIVSTLSNCGDPEPIPEESSKEKEECFLILVWNAQCEFAQCVVKYLQTLQFGTTSCEALETLKNKKRALEILNCYDPRDIENNTTEYNNISYSEIKKLLNL